MSEKRKPVYILFAQKGGQPRKQKIEIFRGSDFLSNAQYLTIKGKRKAIFRLRVNGVWFPKGTVTFYSEFEVMNLFRNAVNLKYRK